MRPLTETLPKYLLEVAGRPFADHQLAWLARAGVLDIVLCIGHLGDAIREQIGDGSRWGLRVSYVDEGGQLRGTAGALRLARDEGALAPEFAVLYGDSYLDVSIADVFEDFHARRPEALMCTLHNRSEWDVSNAQVADGWVQRYEKGVAEPAEAGLEHIDYGLSILAREVVDEEIPPDEVLDLADMYTRLAQQGRLAAHEVDERFYEIGSPRGLEELDRVLRARMSGGDRR